MTKLTLIFYPKQTDFFSVKFGCVRDTDSYIFLSSSLISLVKTLDNDDFVISVKEFQDK